MTQRSIRRPLPEPPQERSQQARVCGVPGPTEVIVRFEHGGERYSLVWSVRDHRHRARDRQLERRFFASIRCASE